MPYTEDQKRNAVVNAGLDPNVYTFDEGSWSFVDRSGYSGFNTQDANANQPTTLTPQQPVEIPKSIEQAKKTSATGAFLANAAANFLPAGAAFLAGGAAGGLGTAVGGPVVGLPAAIGTGMAAAGGVESLQNKLLPESWRQYLENARQEHNLASVGGSVAGGFGFVRPSVSGLKQLGSGIVNLGTKAAGPALATKLTPGQIGVLANSAIGAATPLAVEGVQRLRGQEARPIGELALEMAGGALSTTPTRLGQRLGMHPLIPDTQYEIFESAPKVGSGKPLSETIVPEPVISEEVKIPRQELDKQVFKVEAEDAFKKELEAAYAEEQAKNDIFLRENPPEKVKEVSVVEPVKTQVTHEVIPPAETPAQPNDLRLNDLYEAALEKQATSPEVTKPEAAIESKVDKQIKAESNKLTLAEPKSVPPPEEIPFPFFQRVKSALQREPATSDIVDYFKRLGADYRNYKVDEQQNVYSPEGERSKGLALVSKGTDEALITIDKALASQDTLPHEATHAFLNYLRHFSPPETKEALARVSSKIEKTPEYVEWKKNYQNPSPEEFLADKVGLQTIDRLKNRDNSFRNGLQDLFSGIKASFSRNPDNYVRLLSRKLLFDPANAPKVEPSSGAAVKTQLPSAPENTKQPDNIELDLPLKEKLSNLLDVLSPAVDKVRKLGPTGEKAAEALENYFAKRDKLEAIYSNVPLSSINKEHFTPGELSEASNFMREKFRGSEGVKAPTDERVLKAVELFREPLRAIREYQNSIGLPVFDSNGKAHKGAVSEYYWPDMLNDKALRLFATRPESATATKAKQLWAEYVNEQSKNTISVEDALKKIDGYVSSISGGSGDYFNALTKVRGFGIPEVLRETDTLKTFEKYMRRATKTLSYYEHLSSKPDISYALGLDRVEGGGNKAVEGVQNISSAEPVVNAMKFVSDEFPRRRAPVFQSIQRVVTNGLLGPLSGIKDVASVPFLAAPYIQKLEDLGAYASAIKDWQKYTKESLEYGSRSNRIDRRRWANILDEGDAVTHLNALADALRKYQGRDLLEQTARIFTHGLGSELAKLNLVRASNGDAKAKAWLERFSRLNDKPLAEWGSQEIAQVGKNFTDAIQGTYDARGLPSGMFDHPLASTFFPLQRWSIERFNNIRKDVLVPAKQGDLKPLLLATLGGVMGGAAIQQLSQLLSGKKQYDPTLEEAAKTGNVEQEVAAIAAMMQAGSYMGIVGDIFKAGIDLAVQKRAPQLGANPTFEAAETATQAVVDAKEALDKGENPIEVVGRMSLALMMQQIQTARLVRNWVDREGVKEKEEARDLATFRKLVGGVEPADSYNPMAGVASRATERKFDRAINPEEIVSLGKELVGRALENSKDPRTGEINPQKLSSNLQSIKTSTQDTKMFPANPYEQKQYFDFLSKTQGEKEALERYKKFLQLKQLKQTKASLIPSY